MTKAEKAKCAKLGREDVEALLGQLCIASVRLDEQNAKMNENLALVRQSFEPEMAAFGIQVEELTEQIRAWADANPQEFVTRKSIAMVHGTLGYRTGTPALKTVRGVTWEKVLALLQVNLPNYIRVRKEVDKEQIITDRELLGDENLKTLGVRVEQAERFFVEPNKEAVSA